MSWHGKSEETPLRVRPPLRVKYERPNVPDSKNGEYENMKM